MSHATWTLVRWHKFRSLIDKYYLHGVTEIFTDMWFDQLKSHIPETFTEEVPSWLCASWVFQKPESFHKPTKIAMREGKKASLQTVQSLTCPYPPGFSVSIPTSCLPIQMQSRTLVRLRCPIATTRSNPSRRLTKGVKNSVIGKSIVTQWCWTVSSEHSKRRISCPFSSRRSWVSHSRFSPASFRRGRFHLCAREPTLGFNETTAASRRQ